MKNKIVNTIIGVALLFSTAEAQSDWTLQACIAYALENNVEITNADYAIEEAWLENQKASSSRMPLLDANIGGGYQFGRTIDPTTNGFESNTISYSTYSISGSVPVYNGGRISKQIEKAKLELGIAEADSKAIERNITLAITESFLNVLLAKEQLENNKVTYDQSKTQLERVEKQIKLGVLAQNDQLEFTAQVLRDRTNVIEAQNQVELMSLNLKQLMGLTSEAVLDLSAPENHAILAYVDQFDLTVLYHKAEINEPQLRADELRLYAAEKTVDIAKTNYYPSVSIFGTLSTNSSSEAKEVESMETIQFSQPGLLNGEPILLSLEQDIPNLSDVRYGKQLKDNFGQGIGLSVSIPIYQANKNRISVEKAKVGVLRARTNWKNNLQNLKMEVLKSRNSWAAAREAYLANERSRAAFELAYIDARRRLDLGRGSSYEVINAKSNLDRSKFDFVRSKYQVIFYQCILNYYLGHPMELN